MRHMKVLLAFSLLYLWGCWDKVDDAYNQIIICNNTVDTISFVIKKNTRLYYPISPKENYILAIDDISNFEIIENNWGKTGDTIEIYRNDTLMVKWGAPLREMPDSIHDFYNKNSWILEEGGYKNEYIIATFTITEEDFKN